MAVTKKKTASKKKASKKKALATRGSKSVSTKNVMDRLQARRERDAQRKQNLGQSDYITISRKGFTYKGADLGTEFDAVILDFSYLNEWFDREFDKDNPCGPACFALSMDGPDFDEMKPHEKSPVPQGGEDGDCASCSFNEFGSGKVGRSKACGNKRRLALIPADTLENIKKAEIAFFKTGVHTGLNFAKYQEGVDRMDHVPICAVVTTISLDEESEQPQALFEKKAEISDPDTLDEILDVAESVVEKLMEPYDPSGYEAIGTGRGRGRGRGKTTTKKASKKKARRSKFS